MGGRGALNCASPSARAECTSSRRNRRRSARGGPRRSVWRAAKASRSRQRWRKPRTRLTQPWRTSRASRPRRRRTRSNPRATWRPSAPRLDFFGRSRKGASWGAGASAGSCSTRASSRTMKALRPGRRSTRARSRSTGARWSASRSRGAPAVAASPSCLRPPAVRRRAPASTSSRRRTSNPSLSGSTRCSKPSRLRRSIMPTELSPPTAIHEYE
mmetsp:Transcript_2434/g.8938  ORF Transcript_2434/g.8938 Transcript_2434/m.8938 type:complete len:214 (+) Transcript_2434:1104-1745(+)